MECPPRSLDIEKSACSIIVETLALAHTEDATRLQDARIAGMMKAWQFRSTSVMFPRKSALILENRNDRH